MIIDKSMIDCLLPWARTYANKSRITLEIGADDNGRIICEVFRFGICIAHTQIGLTKEKERELWSRM